MNILDLLYMFYRSNNYFHDAHRTNGAAPWKPDDALRATTFALQCWKPLYLGPAGTCIDPDGALRAPVLLRCNAGNHYTQGALREKLTSGIIGVNWRELT